MPYKLFNGNTNIISDLINKYRIKKGYSYSQLSEKLELLGVTLYKNDLFLIEKNRRIVRDFELIALLKALDITDVNLESLLDI